MSDWLGIFLVTPVTVESETTVKLNSTSAQTPSWTGNQTEDYCLLLLEAFSN